MSSPWSEASGAPLTTSSSREVQKEEQIRVENPIFSVVVFNSFVKMVLCRAVLKLIVFGV